MSTTRAMNQPEGFDALRSMINREGLGDDNNVEQLRAELDHVTQVLRECPEKLAWLPPESVPNFVAWMAVLEVRRQLAEVKLQMATGDGELMAAKTRLAVAAMMVMAVEHSRLGPVGNLGWNLKERGVRPSTSSRPSWLNC